MSVNVVIAKGQLARVQNTLNRLGGANMSIGPGWSASDTGSGVSRTGGPTPVNVSNNVGVYLDGQPFYAMTVRAVQDRSDRDAWRRKVGHR